MFEDIAEVVLGPVGVALVASLVFPDGRKVLRKAAKAAIHAGLTVSDCLQEAAKEAKARAEELIEEVKAECEIDGKGHKAKPRAAKGG